jgi:hypothetical protein
MERGIEPAARCFEKRQPDFEKKDLQENNETSGRWYPK